MGQLTIAANRTTQGARSQARGKLFERLMSQVISHMGYSVDSKPNVNYAGMEIDIEGRQKLAGAPMYAECKCYETLVDAPKFNEFFGKYMTRWFRDKRAQGIFIALPGVNSHVKGLYKEHCEGNQDIIVRLCEREAVLDALFEARAIPRPDLVAERIPQEFGRAGDWEVLYSDAGLFWLQYVLKQGAAVASAIALFDSQGHLLTEKSAIKQITDLRPEIGKFEIYEPAPSSAAAPPSAVVAAPTTPAEPEEIVEVRGGSAWFEYQFPASPEHFVGRDEVLRGVDAFAASVLRGETSARGLLFEANSGWGKSSVVLACVSRLGSEGHLAVAVDCRSVTSSASILRIVELARREFSREVEGDLFYGALPECRITGFEGAIQCLLGLGSALKGHGKLAFIFLDQFENIFFLPDTLRRLRDVLLRVCDAETNVVLGFCWKGDLIASTSEFPYELRDSIARVCHPLPIDTFSEKETNALLSQLESELRSKLRKDLRFFLSEFSQGYPWLLKKLCAHVKAQRGKGVQQSEIANRLLNIEELFQEDLSGLSPEQEDALRRIARLAPVAVSELSDQFAPELVSSLVDRRLLVRIGHKYDIYWDIFRDYLNTGGVPVQQNYILRVEVNAVLKAAKTISDAGGEVKLAEFMRRGGLSEHSAYNVAKDMRLLGLAQLEGGSFRLQVQVPRAARDADLIQHIRVHLRERLAGNRLVSSIVQILRTEGPLRLDELSQHLAGWCPYVSATPKTWEMYSRILAKWMDLADLGMYDPHDRLLSYYDPGAELRQRDIKLAPRRGRGIPVPTVQYSPIEKLATSLGGLLRGGRLNEGGLRLSTMKKAFSALEDLGFVARAGRGFRLTPTLYAFVSASPEGRRDVFAHAAMRMNSFATFVAILREQPARVTHAKLALEIKRRLGASWADGTAMTNVKIMMDWASHAGLLPKPFAGRRTRGARPRPGNTAGGDRGA